MTARHICRDYKLKCDIPRLMKDSAYNTMLGSAYVADRMEEFSGSYVLALASYNAGPGRAREWISEFGDPRSRQGRSDRLDPSHSDRGDARVRAEGAVQHPGLPRAARRRGQCGAAQHGPEACFGGPRVQGRGEVGSAGKQAALALRRGRQQLISAPLLQALGAPLVFQHPACRWRVIRLWPIRQRGEQRPCRTGATSALLRATACGSTRATMPCRARRAGPSCAWPASRATDATSTILQRRSPAPIDPAATSTRSTAAAAATPSTTATGRTIPFSSRSTTRSTS